MSIPFLRMTTFFFYVIDLYSLITTYSLFYLLPLCLSFGSFFILHIFILLYLLFFEKFMLIEEDIAIMQASVYDDLIVLKT